MASMMMAFGRIWLKLTQMFVLLFALMFWYATIGFLIFGKSCQDTDGKLDPSKCNTHDYFGSLGNTAACTFCV